MKSDCEGCLTRRELRIHCSNIEYHQCIINKNAPKAKCPCRICLVKMICDKQCQDFFFTVSGIFNMYVSYDYKRPKPGYSAFSEEPNMKPWYNITSFRDMMKLLEEKDYAM